MQEQVDEFGNAEPWVVPPGNRPRPLRKVGKGEQPQMAKHKAKR